MDKSISVYFPSLSWFSHENALVLTFCFLRSEFQYSLSEFELPKEQLEAPGLKSLVRPISTEFELIAWPYSSSPDFQHNEESSFAVSKRQQKFV